MNVQLDYRSVLTTDHPLSSYGVPVLLLDGRPYGAGDYLPIDNGLDMKSDGSAVTAGELVAWWVNSRARGGDPHPKCRGMKFSTLARHTVTDEQVEAARLFCASCPGGPQVA